MHSAHAGRGNAAAGERAREPRCASEKRWMHGPLLSPMLGMPDHQRRGMEVMHSTMWATVKRSAWYSRSVIAGVNQAASGKAGVGSSTARLSSSVVCYSWHCISRALLGLGAARLAVLGLVQQQQFILAV